MAIPGNQDTSVDGMAVIVTGGARGIGAELVRHFSASGAKVVVADVLEKESAALVQELQAQGADAMAHRTDVSDEQSVAGLVEAVTSRFGRIDALINNAAMYQDLGSKKRFDEISVDEWDRVMAVNARGVWLAIRGVYPVMREHEFGRIVNMASSTVHMGVPMFAHYTASKGAVMALTRSIAREVGRDGITVNAVAPGLVQNESSGSLNDPAYFPVAAAQRAIPRSQAPEDLVGTVKFLCSAASEFMTGQTLIVDGGATFV